jgi:cytochrome c-type biogenesis protein CcmH
MNSERTATKLQITNYGWMFAVIIAVAFSVAFVMTASAQSGAPTDDEVNRIAKQLYCPVCENTPLDVCPTEACRQWRELIRTMLAQGKSEAEIKEYFVNQYGARVLNVPPNRLVTYLIPAVAILLGAFMLFRGFQMWMKPLAAESTAGEGEAQAVPQDEYIAWLEDELQKRK